jgi:hypothetical protein
LSKLHCSAWKFNEVHLINHTTKPYGENTLYYEDHPRELAVYQILLAFLSVLRIRDPVPFDPWSRDPKWVKNQDLDHISESLETIFWVKILKFFDADVDPDPGSENPRIFLTWIRDRKNLDPG